MTVWEERKVGRERRRQTKGQEREAKQTAREHPLVWRDARCVGGCRCALVRCRRWGFFFLSVPHAPRRCLHPTPLVIQRRTGRDVGGWAREGVRCWSAGLSAVCRSVPVSSRRLVGKCHVVTSSPFLACHLLLLFCIRWVRQSAHAGSGCRTSDGNLRRRSQPAKSGQETNKRNQHKASNNKSKENTYKQDTRLTTPHCRCLMTGCSWLDGTWRLSLVCALHAKMANT